MRIMSPMKSHLYLRHIMNFMVLHGFVNQKKDVSGRLFEHITTYSITYSV